MNYFFTSDTHFGHTNIIKYVKRPFKDAEEMNEALITNWNRVVGPTDIVYHLGDFAMGIGPEKTRYVRNIRRRLNGGIHFYMGNHDPDEWRLDGLEGVFDSLADYGEVVVHNQKIVLFHYGMRTWHHDLRGVWHLYGHSHGGLAPYGKSCDVGVDCWNFTPVSFWDLKRKMDKLEIGKHPQWENYVPSS